MPGLPAKPIIDLLLGVERLADAERCTPVLERLGYERVAWIEELVPGRRYFDKGPAGAKTYHLHAVEVGTEHWAAPLAFRDWLRTHPEDARAYQRLKRELAAQFTRPGEEYGDAKNAFVLSILERARQERDRVSRD